MKKLLSPFLVLAIFTILSCGDSTMEPTVETTVSVSAFTASIDEGAAEGTIIGSANGNTNQGTISYSLSDINPGGAIAINSSNGEITVADASAFDFETNTQITATLVASNSSITDEAPVTININDVDESTPKVIWTGDVITFSKAEGADPTDEANQDRITDNVWITRDNDGGQIFNIKTETADDKNASPKDTEWAVGTIENIDALSFQPFRDALGKPKEQVGTDLVVHLITDDIYLSLKITSWDEGKKGGFAYERSSM